MAAIVDIITQWIWPRKRRSISNDDYADGDRYRVSTKRKRLHAHCGTNTQNYTTTKWDDNSNSNSNANGNKDDNDNPHEFFARVVKSSPVKTYHSTHTHDDDDDDKLLLLPPPASDRGSRRTEIDRMVGVAHSMTRRRYEQPLQAPRVVHFHTMPPINSEAESENGSSHSFQSTAAQVEFHKSRQQQQQQQQQQEQQQQQQQQQQEQQLLQQQQHSFSSINQRLSTYSSPPLPPPPPPPHFRVLTPTLLNGSILVNPRKYVYDNTANQPHHRHYHQSVMSSKDQQQHQHANGEDHHGGEAARERPQQQQQQQQVHEYDDVVNEELIEKMNSVMTLRELVGIYELDQKLTVEQMGIELHAEIISQFVEELLVTIVSEGIREEVPSLMLDEILGEELERIVKRQKEVLPFSEEEFAIVDDVLANNRRSRQAIVNDKFNIAISRDSISCLSPTEWLSDEVINFYFEMMNERGQAHADLPKCHFFNTFFYSKLIQGGKYQYANVRRWTRKTDLFSMDKIIIPVHLGKHWTLCVINLRDKRYEYYDSMGGVATGHKIIKIMKQYIHDESMDKKKQPFVTDDWETFIPDRYTLPQQKNGYDCGVFTCKFANCIAQDLPIFFTQRHIPYFRQRMALEIQYGCII